MIPWLADVPDFPPVTQALQEPNGLLAAGGTLSPEWLITAYRRGIFPWYSPGEPILWWSPDPRLVLEPPAVYISRSMRRLLQQNPFEIRVDSAFSDVIEACAAPRHAESGTWITAAIRSAYETMHTLGYAHSVECWQEGKLVGGLYGIGMGRMFFGESMFHQVSNASKVALIYLARILEQKGYALIDCQMTTSHLLSMGAHEISRAAFCEALERWAQQDTPVPARWTNSDIDTILDNG